MTTAHSETSDFAATPSEIAEIAKQDTNSLYAADVRALQEFAKTAAATIEQHRDELAERRLTVDEAATLSMVWLRLKDNGLSELAEKVSAIRDRMMKL